MLLNQEQTCQSFLMMLPKFTLNQANRHHHHHHHPRDWHSNIRMNNNTQTLSGRAEQFYTHTYINMRHDNVVSIDLKSCTTSCFDRSIDWYWWTLAGWLTNTEANANQVSVQHYQTLTTEWKCSFTTQSYWTCYQRHGYFKKLTWSENTHGLII